MSIALRLRERKAQEAAANQTTESEHAPPDDLQQAPIILRNAPVDTQHPPESDPLSQIRQEDCNPQTDSAIVKIPAELRQLIYHYVFVQYESRANAYSRDALYYRPGCTAPKRINTALLYTCRRLFFEARFIPLRTATHDFWGSVHSPEQHTEPSPMIPSHRCARGLTEAHLPYMQRFHFYGSLHNFASSTRFHMTLLSLPDSPYQCQPRHVTITVPYTGWLHWEYGCEPELYSDYGGEVEIFELDWPASLERLRVRFETLEVFAPEVEKVMAQIMTRKISRESRDGEGPSQYLSAEGTRMSVSRWTGPHSQYFKDSWQPPIEHLGPDPMDVSELWYYVVETTWSSEA